MFAVLVLRIEAELCVRLPRQGSRLSRGLVKLHWSSEIGCNEDAVGSNKMVANVLARRCRVSERGKRYLVLRATEEEERWLLRMDCQSRRR